MFKLFVYITKIINTLELDINKTLYNNSLFPINLTLVDEYTYNYSVCLNYSFIFLNNSEFLDIMINESIVEIINITFYECFNVLNNEENVSNINNYTIIEEIDYLQNTSKECFNYLNKYGINEIENKFLDESIKFLDCINNHFYSYSDEYLNQKYGNIVENTIYKIKNKIENSYIDANFLINYLEKKNSIKFI